MTTPEPAGTGQPRIDLARGRVLLAATGSITVVGLPEWISMLRARFGWTVRVCLTHSADQLVSRRALAAVSGSPVDGPSWETERGVVPHQELAAWPDLVIVAPASLNFLAKLAHGMADSLALTAVLSTRAPVVIAPSLPEAAAVRPSVQRNLALLAEDGHRVVPMEPAYSVHQQAMIATGMPRWPAILRHAAAAVADRGTGTVTTAASSGGTGPVTGSASGEAVLR
ncbi:flavoprotein [Streptomyces lonarensis]|uniref:Pantothenate metabolism flavoprotein n=1 Tax=Streptomyces lonarensis TaxID=700599 RepID=A0A7X6HXN2_9ACTN|nr:flavoprotein [Streptomyces lonarensis]NJQ04485.1 pantothenate metabolism flavoprotein [Streptomyces lonarensis]